MAFTRRTLLSTLCAAAHAQTRPAAPAKPTEPVSTAAAAAPEWTRFADAATEFEVRRLTSPEYESALPIPPARAFDRRSRSLLFASTRSGAWQPWLMDLQNGTSRQIGTFETLEPASLTLSADDRSALFLDGRRLVSAALSGGKTLTLAELPADARLSGCLAPTIDSSSVFFLEELGGRARLRRLRSGASTPDTLLEAEPGLRDLSPNPRRAMVHYLNAAGELRVCAFDGTLQRRLETPAGRVHQAFWSSDGQSILYLFEPAEAGQLIQIREQSLDARTDALISKTSQFGSFARNANGSVFVGASLSKASPHILILLRSTRREFTLCEHKNSTLARLVLAPNSQRVAFQSDRAGRACLYLVNVERLLEKTDS